MFQFIWKFILNAILWILFLGFIAAALIIVYVNSSYYDDREIPYVTNNEQISTFLWLNKEPSFIEETGKPIETYKSCNVVSSKTKDLNNLVFNCMASTDIVTMKLFNVSLTDFTEETYEQERRDFFNYLGKKHYKIYIMKKEDNISYWILSREGENINNIIINKFDFAFLVKD